MDSIKDANDALYISEYVNFNHDAYMKIWNRLKSNNSILRESFKIVKNKCGEESLQYSSICEAILMDSDSVDSGVYQELVDIIYSNKRAARIVLSDRYDSFLLLTLMNPNLKLTEEQKRFAVEEANLKYGTVNERTSHEKKMEEYKKSGISIDKKTSIDIGNVVCSMDETEFVSYLDTAFTLLSSSQVHGFGSFDIRYWILRNPNWYDEEKKQLVYDFYAEDEDYTDTMNDWKWDIVNDSANYDGTTPPPFDIYDLFTDWSYDMLLNFYKDKDIADRIWEDIEFCNKMCNFRPPIDETYLEEEEKKLS